MAVLAVAAAGAWAGSALITGTVLGMSGAAWGWMAGSMLGNALFAPDAEGPRLGDLRVTGSEYGQPIPWVAGSPRIAGQIVWASNKRETANTQSAKGGPEQTTYTYDCDLLILLTENEIAGVSRIWSNGELVWGNGQTKSGVWADLRVYTGAADQMPDPTYEAAVGAGNAPAYRGRGYVVIQGLQLGGGGQIPNLTFEVGQGVRSSDVWYLYRPDGLGGNQFNDYSVWQHPGPYQEGSVNYSITGDGIVYFPIGSSMRLSTPPADKPSFTLPSDFTVDLRVTLDVPVFSGSIDTAFWFLYELGTPQGTGSYAGLYFAQARFQGVNGGIALVYGDGVSATNIANIANPTGVTDSGFNLFSDVIALSVMRKGARFYLRVVGLNAYGQFAGEIYSVSKTVSVTNIVPTYYPAIGGNASAFGMASTDQGFTLSHFRLANRALYSGISDMPSIPLTDLIYINGEQTPQTLDMVLFDLMGRAGYLEFDFDLSSLVGDKKSLRAVAVGQVVASRATIEVLQSAWFLEASKSDRIYIRPRATTPVATIPWADLGASEDAVSDAEPLALTMANDLEIPGQIALSYPNVSGDYQVATEHSDRLLSGQESVQAMQMPLGMLPAEAKALADALLFDQVAGMTKTTIRLPLRYAYIEPGDVIEAVNFDGRSYRLRVQVKRDTLSIIELDCVLDDVGALDSAAVTDTGYISTTEPVRVAPTVFEALDIPLLRDADNSPGYYVAVGAQRESADDEWKGALVARSWDDTSYAELFRATDEGVMATCSTTLGDWTGGNVWDEANTLTVVTSGGELASSTRSAMQADETLNVLAVGSQATGWELLRFRNAVLTDANTYVLSGFLRGFRGTEWRMGSHAAGEQAVLLDAALRRATSQTSQIGLASYIKAVTFSQVLANVDSELFVDTGEALRPWAPAHPVALADDDGDLVLTWQRRTRMSHRYDGDSPAVPLGEATELYRVRVYDGATLVRTAMATEPTYLYTAAEQAADGFAPGDPVIFEICQVSETVGAGRPAICTGVAP